MSVELKPKEKRKNKRKENSVLMVYKCIDILKLKENPNQDNSIT